jgi:hypothetical protein
VVKIDMVGKRFGRLVVIGRADDIDPGRPRWLCRCDCGNERVVRGISLRKGDTKSCGCIQKERMKLLSESHITHGKSKTRLYRIWFNIKCRCYKSSFPDYARYGGRGIKVCDEWKDNFQAFYDWSTSNGYLENLTIDRIDNDGDYSPQNCRWVNTEVQNNNTRRNYYITLNGETLTLSQWAKKCGINRNTLYSRITKYGWSVERALTEKEEVH